MRGIVLLAAILLVTGTGSATTWIVAQHGSADATTIQDGMDLATEGDSVLVMAGTYTGRVDLKSGVALIGDAGAEATTLDAAGSSVCIEGYDLSGSLVQGLTLTGVTHTAYWWTGEAALEAQGEVEVRDCVIEGNYAIGGGIHGSGTLAVFGTRFSRNWGGTDATDVGAIQWENGELSVENCVFEHHFDGLVRMGGQAFSFTDNIVRDNDPASFIFVAYEATPIRAIFERNLFLDNNGTSIEDWNSAPQLSVEIRANTYIRSPAFVACEGRAVVENNLFTGSLWGLEVWSSHSKLELRCNNSWGNEENWRSIPDPTGTDGNISEPPLMCDPSGRQFTLAKNSPCLPANNSCGVQMGAFGMGCEPVSVTPESWARVKARYR